MFKQIQYTAHMHHNYIVLNYAELSNLSN